MSFIKITISKLEITFCDPLFPFDGHAYCNRLAYVPMSFNYTSKYKQYVKSTCYTSKFKQEVL